MYLQDCHNFLVLRIKRRVRYLLPLRAMSKLFVVFSLADHLLAFCSSFKLTYVISSRGFFIKFRYLHFYHFFDIVALHIFYWFVRYLIIAGASIFFSRLFSNLDLYLHYFSRSFCNPLSLAFLCLYNFVGINIVLMFFFNLWNFE